MTLNANRACSNWQWSQMQHHACPLFETNLLIKMWHLVTTSILVSNFHEYVKVVELVMVQVVAMCKMKTIYLLWLLSNPSFTIDSPLICPYFCTCLHNASILYKIPLIKSALNNGDVFATTMMVRVNALTFEWVSW